MITFVVTIHVIVCALLIILVLVQRGRGGGLVESFAGVESMFGTKTNAFLTRATTVLSIIFFFTCLFLAVTSVRQSKSLLSGVKQAPIAAKQSSGATQAAAGATAQPTAATQPAASSTAPAQATEKGQGAAKADKK